MNLKQYIETTCQSMFEGCMCDETKHHVGLHKCGSKDCDTTWDDAQAYNWYKKFQR